MLPIPIPPPNHPGVSTTTACRRLGRVPWRSHHTWVTVTTPFGVRQGDSRRLANSRISSPPIPHGKARVQSRRGRMTPVCATRANDHGPIAEQVFWMMCMRSSLQNTRDGAVALGRALLAGGDPTSGLSAGANTHRTRILSCLNYAVGLEPRFAVISNGPLREALQGVFAQCRSMESDVSGWSPGPTDELTVHLANTLITQIDCCLEHLQQVRTAADSSSSNQREVA